MKNWEKKASELSQWELKGVPMKYPIAFIILLLPILFWNFNNIRYFDEFEIAPDSATYLLSALVQSLAAIIAIVVTLTLVAVQLAASAYSPRVIDIFKKDWVMWFLLVWYGLSIFFGLFVLEVIGGKYQNLSHWGVSLESCVFIVYLMGVAAFVGVFFHIGNVIDLLKPENIIKRLADKITSENVLEFIISEEKQNRDRTSPAKDDPVQPIVDVIHGAVMKYDIATTRYGLKAITEKAIEVVRSEYLFSWDDVPGNDSKKLLENLNDKFGIDWAKLKDIHKSDEMTITISEGGNSVEITLDEDKENATEATLKIISDDRTHDLEVRKENGKLNIYRSDCEKETSKHFCMHLERVGKLALNREDEESVIKVLESLESFGESTAKQKLGDAAEQATQSLGVVGIAAAEKRLVLATSQAAAAIGYVGKFSVENKLGDAAEIVGTAVFFLESIGKAAAEKRLEVAPLQAAFSLGFVGKAAAEKELEAAACEVVKSLMVVGMTAARNELGNATLEVVNSLGAVGIAAAEKRLKVAPLQAARSLGVVGKIIAENGLEDATKQVARSLEYVGKLTAENGLSGATFEVTKSLGVILKIISENEHGDATKQVARSLGVVGIVAYNRMVVAEKEGKQGEREELNRRTEEVAEHLAKLSMSLEESKEILLGARSDTKKLHIGSESFYGFLEIYKDAVDNSKSYEPNPYDPRHQ